MNNKTKLSSIQSIILVAAVAYVVMPDLCFGPIDDSVVALIAGVAELVLGIAKSRIPTSTPTPTPDEWDAF